MKKVVIPRIFYIGHERDARASGGRYLYGESFVLKQISCIQDFCGVSNTRATILHNFGTHVKNLRLNKNMTQVEVSARMDRDQQSLQRIESGKVNPSLLYLLDLAEALDVSISELVGFRQSEF